VSFAFKPVGPEQKILTEARQLLGANMADYVLSGLGEAQVTNCRVFASKGTVRDIGDVTYRFEVRSDSAQGLPAGRDPIVMAALIGLLRERQPIDDAVTFGVGPMLETLRWPQSIESHMTVTRAVEKYAATTYCLIDRPLPEGEGIRSHFRRLVISYEITSKPAAGKAKVSETAVRVQFWPYFVNSFALARKSFLGVEFQTLRGIEEVPCVDVGRVHAEGLERR